jgi:hypothetical protein
VSSSAGSRSQISGVDPEVHHSSGIETSCKFVLRDRVECGRDLAHLSARERTRGAVPHVFVPDLGTTCDDETERRLTAPGLTGEKEVQPVPGLIDVELVGGIERWPRRVVRGSERDNFRAAEEPLEEPTAFRRRVTETTRSADSSP